MDFKDNETVTISLERYTELKELSDKWNDLTKLHSFNGHPNQLRRTPFNSRQQYLIEEYMRANQLVFIYQTEEIKLITQEEADNLFNKK